MGVEEIVSKLGIGKKETVYLSVTPGVGLELIQLNIQTKTVKNYAYRPLHYNESLRELGDMEAFKTAVTELFAELRLNIRSDVVLNIPMVMFGSKELPVLLADEAVTEALTSEAEQSYIFKRYEPVVSWVDASNTSSSNENRKLYYSAVQQNVIEDIKTSLHELGMKLVDIQLSMFSLLRALIYSGALEEQTKDGISWNLMVVNSNGYSITSLVGKNIYDYYEEPLAIKSFEGEEIYGAISASAQISLMSYPANYLVVVSETDLVSAELLSARLQIDGKLSFFENNSFKRSDLINVSLEILEETAQKISLEAIGVAVSDDVYLPIEFNFMGGTGGKRSGDDPDEPIHVVLGSYEFDISQNGARNIALVLAVVLLVPFLLFFLTVPMVTKKKQAQLDELNAKVQQTQAQLKSLQDEQNRYDSFDVNSEVKKVLAGNRTKLMGYIAIGESVPKNLWLTYFIAKGDGKFNIKGKASTVQDVYTFYNGVKESLINVPLRLQSLEMDSPSVDDAISVDPTQPTMYSFEITNMSQSDFATQPAEKANSDQQPASTENNDGNAQNSQNDQSILNKPLLNLGKNN